MSRSNSASVNLSHDQIVEAIGRWVVDHRFPDHEGETEVIVCFSINKRTFEMSAHAEVTLTIES